MGIESNTKCHLIRWMWTNCLINWLFMEINVLWQICHAFQDEDNWLIIQTLLCTSLTCRAKCFLFYLTEATAHKPHSDILLRTSYHPIPLHCTYRVLGDEPGTANFSHCCDSIGDRTHDLPCWLEATTEAVWAILGL